MRGTNGPAKVQYRSPRREEHPHGLSQHAFDRLFTRDRPIILACHGYPSLTHCLAYRRTNHANLHVRDKRVGHREYIERSATTSRKPKAGLGAGRGPPVDEPAQLRSTALFSPATVLQ